MERIKLEHAINYFVEKTKTDPVKYAPVLAELTRMSARPGGMDYPMDERRLRQIVIRSEAMNRKMLHEGNQNWETIIQELKAASNQSQQPQQDATQQ